MKITITFDDKTYYRDCGEAYRWTGVIKDAPDWLTDLLADKEAIIVRGSGIFFITVHGYPHADIGDIIVKDGNKIDVIRGFK